MRRPLYRAPVPPIFQKLPGESWRDRHARRAAEAFKRLPAIQGICRALDLRLVRDGHELAFLREDRQFLCRWYPSRGLLFISGTPGFYVKVHDVRQLSAVLVRIAPLAQAREIEAIETTIANESRKMRRLSRKPKQLRSRADRRRERRALRASHRRLCASLVASWRGAPYESSRVSTPWARIR